MNGWRSQLAWSETSRERYRVAADSPEQAQEYQSVVNNYGFTPGHRQPVNSAVLVDEEKKLLRVGESCRLVSMEVRRD